MRKKLSLSKWGALLIVAALVMACSSSDDGGNAHAGVDSGTDTQAVDTTASPDTTVDTGIQVPDVGVTPDTSVDSAPPPDAAAPDTMAADTMAADTTVTDAMASDAGDAMANDAVVTDAMASDAVVTDATASDAGDAMVGDAAAEWTCDQIYQCARTSCASLVDFTCTVGCQANGCDSAKAASTALVLCAMGNTGTGPCAAECGGAADGGVSACDTCVQTHCVADFAACQANTCP